MSDVAATAAPAAPAAAAPEAPKTHHSATQPRTPQGQFTPPTETATETPAPQRWKVGDEEFDNADDLARVAAERTVERKSIEAHYRRAQELEVKARQLEAALEEAKSGKVLDAQTRQRIALEEARRYQEEQELANLPEEQRRLYLHMKALEQKAREAEEKIAAHEKAQKDAEEKARREQEDQQQRALRQELGTKIRTAMEATGLPLNDDLTRMVVAEMEAGLHAGVDYPPEALARRVRNRFYSAANEVVAKEPPAALFKRLPGLVEVLNNLEDPAILRLLAPKLGDRLRRLNLESSGLRPQVVSRTPSAPLPPATSIDPSTLEPGDPRWADVFAERARKARRGE